jgi:hypothetical protein
VTSRAATHDTPGTTLAQPPRRPPRRSPRHHRHQTNSFSFDSSERSSAAYEQQRVSSVSTDYSGTRPLDDVCLHDELRGSSLQSSRATSGVSEALHAQNIERGALDQNIIHNLIDQDREFIFSSPQLPLPRPFSSVSRSPSPISPKSPVASPLGGDLLTPANPTEERSSSRSYSPVPEQRNELNSSPPVRYPDSKP